MHLYFYIIQRIARLQHYIEIRRSYDSKLVLNIIVPTSFSIQLIGITNNDEIFTSYYFNSNNNIV